MFTGILIIIFSIAGIYATFKNMKKYENEGKNFKKKLIKFTALPACIFLFLSGIAVITSPTKDSKPQATASTTITEKSSSKSTTDQRQAYQSWINNLKVPIGQYETTLSRFTKTLSAANSGEIEGTTAMDEITKLAKTFDEINLGFRNIESPNKSLFTDEQNKNFWLVKGHFADVANNYNAACNAISRGIQINNKNQIKQSEEYINKANSHINDAMVSLKAIQNSLGVKPDESDDIGVNLN